MKQAKFKPLFYVIAGIIIFCILWWSPFPTLLKYVGSVITVVGAAGGYWHKVIAENKKDAALRSPLDADRVALYAVIAGAFVSMSSSRSDDVAKKKDEVTQQKKEAKQQKSFEEVAADQKRREEQIFQNTQKANNLLDVVSKKKDVNRFEQSNINFNIYPPLNPANTNDPVKRRAIKLYNEGVRLQGMGNDAAAEQEFQSAIALDQKIRGAHNNIGVTRIHRENIQGAISEYNREIAHYPNDAISHFNLGIALAGTEDKENALKELQQAVKLAPKNTIMRNDLALFYIEVGNTPVPGNKVNEANKVLAANIIKAINVLNQSLASNPNDAYARSLFGLALLFQGSLKRTDSLDETHSLERRNKDLANGNIDIARAKSNLDTALALAPQDAHVRLTYARAYAFRGDRLNAIAFIKKAVELDSRLRLDVKYTSEFEILQSDPEFKKLFP